ncbi:hypothetical protein SNEBB_010429 [Seison nebaliae]|nr:hypothetical protein SNEBB_010429 [Seison nebaliae]
MSKHICIRRKPYTEIFTRHQWKYYPYEERPHTTYRSREMILNMIYNQYICFLMKKLKYGYIELKGHHHLDITSGNVYDITAPTKLLECGVLKLNYILRQSSSDCAIDRAGTKALRWRMTHMRTFSLCNRFDEINSLEITKHIHHLCPKIGHLRPDRSITSNHVLKRRDRNFISNYLFNLYNIPIGRWKRGISRKRMSIPFLPYLAESKCWELGQTTIQDDREAREIVKRNLRFSPMMRCI